MSVRKGRKRSGKKQRQGKQAHEITITRVAYPPVERAALKQAIRKAKEARDAREAKSAEAVVSS